MRSDPSCCMRTYLCVDATGRHVLFEYTRDHARVLGVLPALLLREISPRVVDERLIRRRPSALVSPGWSSSLPWSSRSVSYPGRGGPHGHEPRDRARRHPRGFVSKKRGRRLRCRVRCGPPSRGRSHRVRRRTGERTPRPPLRAPPRSCGARLRGRARRALPAPLPFEGSPCTTFLIGVPSPACQGRSSRSHHARRGTPPSSAHAIHTFRRYLRRRLPIHDNMRARAPARSRWS